MPKTKVIYTNQIKFNASDEMVLLLENARRSKGAKYKFGKIPTQTEFLRGVIYNWIRENAAEKIYLNGEVPEILDHMSIKMKKQKL